MKIQTALLAAVMLVSTAQAETLEPIDITELSVGELIILMTRIRDLPPEDQQRVTVNIRKLIPKSEEECKEWAKSGSIFSWDGEIMNNIETKLQCKYLAGIGDILDAYLKKKASWVPSPRHDAYILKFTRDPVNAANLGVDYNLFKDHCMIVRKNDAYCEGETFRLSMGVANYKAHLVSSFDIDEVLERMPISRAAREGTIVKNSVDKAIITSKQMDQMVKEGAVMPWQEDMDHPADPRFHSGDWQ